MQHSFVEKCPKKQSIWEIIGLIFFLQNFYQQQSALLELYRANNVQAKVLW